MRVYVNQSDIDKAEALRDSKKPLHLSCPLWQALVRITGEKVEVCINYVQVGQTLYLTKDSGDYFISQFDAGFTVYPTHITLVPLGTAFKKVKY